MVRRLQQNDRSPFPRGGDGGAEAAGRRAIDDDIGGIMCETNGGAREKEQWT
jgi:hypothetical protein